MGHCQAYVHGSGGMPLAHGGRRHRNCKRPATTSRSQPEGHWSGAVLRTYDFCGQHAAQWDRAERGEGFPPNLRCDW